MSKREVVCTGSDELILYFLSVLVPNVTEPEPVEFFTVGVDFVVMVSRPGRR
jgi:hypothetical protein